VEKGVNVDAKDRHGWTALRREAKNGHLAMVRVLVEKGADVNAIPPFYGGSTALHEAATSGHGAVVWVLVENGGRHRRQDK
jgi:ankyrin repeat protein